MLIALVTDRMFGNDAMIGFSIDVINVPLGLLGLWLTWSGLKPYERTLVALRREAAQR
jgi:hypothetical protein